MALKLESITPQGIVLEDGYIMISNITGNKHNLTITVILFANEIARRNGLQPFWNNQYEVPTSAVNGELLPSLYNYLKTLPEFTGAEDC